MKKLFAAVLASTMLASAAQAAVLVVDGGWDLFFFDEAGSPIRDAETADEFYTFTLTESAFLQVTDAFLIGDVFEITVNGDVFTTGPFVEGGPETDDPQTAFDSGVYSRLSVLLGPGDYTVTGLALESPFGAGGAFIQVTTDGVIPEPATWGLMIAGFGLVGAAMRRRTSAIAA